MKRSSRIILGLLIVLAAVAFFLFQGPSDALELADSGAAPVGEGPARTSANLVRPKKEDEPVAAPREQLAKASDNSAPRNSKIIERTRNAGPKAEPQVQVERSFELSIRFPRTDRFARKHKDGERAEDEQLWAYDQKIRATDLIPSRTPGYEFERRLSGTWSSHLNVGMRQYDWELLPYGESKAHGVSPFKGRKLLFRLDESNAWEITAHQAKRNDPGNLVKGIREDMDLRKYGPSRVPFVGDQWLIEDEDLTDLFQPGGDLQVTFESRLSGHRDAQPISHLEEAFVDFRSPRGNLLMTATGVVPRKGRHREAFDADLEVTFLNESELDYDFGAPQDTETFQHRLTFSGTGKGKWDTEAGGISELTIHGTIKLKRVMKRTGIDEREGTWDGTFTLTVVNRWVDPRPELKMPPRPR